MSVREGPSAQADVVLDEAIWRTLAYAGLFQYPLRLSELHRRLMDVAAGEAQILARVHGAGLRTRISQREDFLQPAGHEDWVEVRRARGLHTEGLLARHRRALAALGRVPFVRMVALSGACAHGNATDDDVDVFLITRPSRCWTVTLLLMIASKIAGLRRSLCVNYVLGEDRLGLPENDRFTASEIVGLRPLAGGSTYRRFVRANDWILGRQPNFFSAYERDSAAVSDAVGAPRFEAFLDAAGGQTIERAARRCLEPHLRRRIGGAGVELTSWRLKLHATDHRPNVSDAFAATLAAEPPSDAAFEASRWALRA